jgi:hypothetical protein
MEQRASDKCLATVIFKTELTGFCWDRDDATTEPRSWFANLAAC